MIFACLILARFLPIAIPQNSEYKTRAYIFERPFLRGLFLEGLILRFKIDWVSL